MNQQLRLVLYQLDNSKTIYLQSIAKAGCPKPKRSKLIVWNYGRIKRSEISEVKDFEISTLNI